MASIGISIILGIPTIEELSQVSIPAKFLNNIINYNFRSFYTVVSII